MSPFIVITGEAHLWRSLLWSQKLGKQSPATHQKRHKSYWGFRCPFLVWTNLCNSRPSILLASYANWWPYHCKLQTSAMLLEKDYMCAEKVQGTFSKKMLERDCILNRWNLQSTSWLFLAGQNADTYPSWLKTVLCISLWNYIQNHFITEKKNPHSVTGHGNSCFEKHMPTITTLYLLCSFSFTNLEVWLE